MIGSEGFYPLKGISLPIFRSDRGEYTAFYAPGCLAVVDSTSADRTTAGLGRHPGGWAERLWQHASQAAAEWRERLVAPFQPVCLTLYLHNECNLRCTYCYADPQPVPAPRLERSAVTAAAELVARNCRQQQLPLTVVFHGGGEPSLHPEQARELLEAVIQTATAYGLPTFKYIATNGVMDESRAAWLAAAFDLVGLSCDGPADLHDRQRPLWSGEGSYARLARTAAVLRAAGRPFHLRATITPAGVERQAEIAQALCSLGPAEIHWEPIYLGGRALPENGLSPELAGRMVDGFFVAQAVARRYGIPLLTSGSRLRELHGPYCHVLRQVLNLAPGYPAGAPAGASACFLLSRCEPESPDGRIIGRYEPSAGQFVLDAARVAALQEAATRLPAACGDCVNLYHCTRVCPSGCALDSSWSDPRREFRCQFQLALTQARLSAASEWLWAGREEASPGTIYGTEDL